MTKNFFFYVFFHGKKGGSGFLGQHIVRLIEERDPTVKEIRILDLQPYKNRLSKYHRGMSERESKETRKKLISTLIFISHLSIPWMFGFHLVEWAELNSISTHSTLTQLYYLLANLINAIFIIWLGHSEHKKLVSIVGDICEEAKNIEHAFEGVDCVFHCAAYINFQYPPNFDELERVNVMGNLLYFKLMAQPTLDLFLLSTYASI